MGDRQIKHHFDHQDCTHCYMGVWAIAFLKSELSTFSSSGQMINFLYRDIKSYIYLYLNSHYIVQVVDPKVHLLRQIAPFAILHLFAVGLLGYLSIYHSQPSAPLLLCLLASGSAIISSVLLARQRVQTFSQTVDKKAQALEWEARERTRIEAELSKSQANLAIAQRVAHVGSWELDVKTKTGIWSEELFRIYGLDPNQPIPTYAELVETIIHPDDRELLEQAVKQAIASGQPFEVDLRIFHPDGSLRHVESRGEPVFDQHGQLIRLIGTVLDITDRKQAKATLEEDSQFLHSIYEGVEESIFVVDVINQGEEFRYVGLNPFHEYLTGISSTQLMGKRPEDVLSPKSAADVTQRYRECFAAGHRITYEECLPFYGEETWWTTSLTPLEDENDRIYRIVGTSTNITMQKRAEQELLRRETQLRTLYEMVVTQGLTFEQRVQRFLELGCQCFDLEFGILSQIEGDRYQVFAVHGLDDLQPNDVFDLSQTYCEITINSADPVGFEYAKESEWFTHPCYQSLRLEAYLGMRVMVNGQLYGTLNFSSLSPRSRQFIDADRELVQLMAQWIGSTLERQNAEAALQQSEARYRAIVEDQTELICRYRPDRTILFVNDAYCRFFDKSKAELIGQSYEPIIYEGDREHVAQLVNSMSVENPLVLIENRVVVEGEIRWTQWINRMIFNQQGHFLEYQSVGRDISDRKQVEERYRNIVENAVDGIFQTSADGRYISANSALARIYGYDAPEELIAQITNIEQQLYVNPQRRTEFVAYINKYGVVSDFESQIYRKDGSMIWVAEDARAVYDQQGKLLYYEGSVRDITERKQIERALLQERQKTETLLLNIFPRQVVDRLKQSNRIIADDFEDVTVLFADIVDFTSFAAQVSPTHLVSLLNQIFSAFDELVDHYHLEKVKTIGDAYMAVGGLPDHRLDHAQAIAELALAMQNTIQRFQRHTGHPFRLRIGINTGSVIAGIIGTRKFSYDLWGDTVNVASRLEAEGIPDRIQISASTYELLKEDYQLEARGIVNIKGKGAINTFWLKGKKQSLVSNTY